MKKTIFITAILIIAFAAVLCVSALGDTISEMDVPLDVEVNASNFEVTLPTSVSLQTGTDGGTEIDEIVIKNESEGPVVIKSATITPKEGWILTGTKDFSDTPVDSQVVCVEFDYNAVEVENGVGKVDFENFEMIAGGRTESHTIQAFLPAQSKTRTIEGVANIRFTVEWYKEN